MRALIHSMVNGSFAQALTRIRLRLRGHAQVDIRALVVEPTRLVGRVELDERFGRNLLEYVVHDAAAVQHAHLAEIANHVGHAPPPNAAFCFASRASLAPEPRNVTVLAFRLIGVSLASVLRPGREPPPEPPRPPRRLHRDRRARGQPFEDVDEARGRRHMDPVWAHESLDEGAAAGGIRSRVGEGRLELHDVIGKSLVTCSTPPPTSRRWRKWRVPSCVPWNSGVSTV